MNKSLKDGRVSEALDLLDTHYDAFFDIADLAARTGHPVPMDTRGWSQILVSVLCGVKGLERKKGADLSDGSDVKAANTWKAIDTPRFNGVIKAGTKAQAAGSLKSLEKMPHLYFVLWDVSKNTGAARCRVWAVRASADKTFQAMCESWYKKLASGEIISNNFQLHPPRGKDSDIFTNKCGNLVYPKLFQASRSDGDDGYSAEVFNPEILTSGACKLAQ